jgi:hypothetical protein
VRGDLPPHGQASEKTLTVRLPAAGMRRVAVNATPAQVHGAYLLTRGRLSSDGTVYGATLDARRRLDGGLPGAPQHGDRDGGRDQFACRLVPRLPQNFVCDGGDLRVRFSGPTG